MNKYIALSIISIWTALQATQKNIDIVYLAQLRLTAPQKLLSISSTYRDSLLETTKTKVLTNILERRKTREFARLCGLLPRKSGLINPVCLEGIADNIIGFLGVAPLRGVPLPDEYNKDTDWAIAPHQELLVATIPVSIGC